MVNGKLLWVSNILIFITLTFSLTSCKKDSSKNQIIEETDTLSVSSIHFENGDLIYRHGNGMFSDFFLRTSKKEQLYSHGGIIALCDDSVYVIHSEASEITGIGGVKKEPINVFLNGISTWAVYRIDTIQEVRDSIFSTAMKYAKLETPFDLDFDNTSDDRVYCTELLSLSINNGMRREVIKANNAIANIRYYSVDDTYLEPNTKLIYKTK